MTLPMQHRPDRIVGHSVTTNPVVDRKTSACRCVTPTVTTHTKHRPAWAPFCRTRTQSASLIPDAKATSRLVGDGNRDTFG